MTRKETITTTYRLEDVDVTLKVKDDCDGSNIHYALATMFARVISDFHLNPDMFLERMADQLEITIEIKSDEN